MMFWSACTSIYILTALSHERYQAVNKQMMGVSNSDMSKPIIKIISCVLLALFWAILPLFGWSRYDFEDLGLSCSFAWKERSINVISYTITVFFAVFFIPLVFMAVVNFRLFWTVSFSF